FSSNACNLSAYSGLCTTNPTTVTYSAWYISHVQTRRRPSSFIVAISLVTLTYLSSSSGFQQSFAHPVYVDSTPGAFESVSSSPGEVQVFFSEAIELPYSSIRVLGPDGSRVDMNDPHNVEGDTASIAATLQPDLPEGEYTVIT